MISGAVMFPVYKNRLMPSQAEAELSATGCHVGQGGGGPHCHAEGFESQGVLGVYSDAEYKGKDSGLEGFGAAADSYRVRSLILGAYKGKLTGTPYFVSKKSGDGATLLGGIYTPSGNRRYSDSHPPPNALNSATVCSSASALLVTRWLVITQLLRCRSALPSFLLFVTVLPLFFLRLNYALFHRRNNFTLADFFFTLLTVLF